MNAVSAHSWPAAGVTCLTWGMSQMIKQVRISLLRLARMLLPQQADAMQPNWLVQELRIKLGLMPWMRLGGTGHKFIFVGARAVLKQLL